MRLRYRPAVIADIQATAEYIRFRLKKPMAAAQFKTTLLHTVSLLKENPYMGALVSSKLDVVDANTRFLVICKQMVFYEICGDCIDVIRVLDGRTDYVAKSFEE